MAAKRNVKCYELSLLGHEEFWRSSIYPLHFRRRGVCMTSFNRGFATAMTDLIRDNLSISSL